MKISIEGTEKEIADLILLAKGQQNLSASVTADTVKNWVREAISDIFPKSV